MSKLIDFLTECYMDVSFDVLAYKVSNSNINNIKDINRIIYCEYHTVPLLELFLDKGFEITNNYVKLFILYQINFDNNNKIVKKSKDLQECLDKKEIIIIDTDIDEILDYGHETLSNILDLINTSFDNKIAVIFNSEKYNNL